MKSTSLIDTLQEGGLKAVTLIDDVYDGQLEDPTHNERAHIWTELELDPVDLLGSVGFKDQSDVTAVWLKSVIDDPVSPFRPAVKASGYLDRTTEKLLQMQKIEDLMKTHLGVTVYTEGAATIAAIKDSQAIFIDLYLGVDHSDEAKQAAIGRAMDTYALFPGEKKPLMVLFSWSPELDALKEWFRQESSLLSGYFYCVPKSQLLEPHLLEAHALNILRAFSHGHSIQRFSDSVIKRLQDGTRILTDTIRNLSVGDYIELQHLCLRGDGQPLGDYLSWILGNSLTDAVFGEALIEERELLNTSDFNALGPTVGTPTDLVAKLYHSAIFDMGVGPVSKHPQDKRPHRSTIPMLTLGDLFLVERVGQRYRKNSNAPSATVYRMLQLMGYAPTKMSAKKKLKPLVLLMLLNPPCDLAHSPALAKPRLPKAGSLVFLPGSARRLNPTGEESASGALEMPYCIVNGVPHQVNWDHKSILSVPLSAFWDWTEERSGFRLRRIGRVRESAAVALQHEVTADLGRVGSQVAPPLSIAVAVDVCHIESKTVVTTESHILRHLIVKKENRKKRYLRFGSEFVVNLMKILVDRRKVVADKKIRPSASLLEKGLSLAWIDLNKEIELKPGGTLLLGGLILITAEGAPATLTDDIAIQIIVKQSGEK